jgi:hypothetical protein
MSQQLSSRYPTDVVEHRKFGARLALLMPPLAALLYPFPAAKEAITRNNAHSEFLTKR